MISRGSTVAFCPSAPCVGASTDTDRDATTDNQGKSQTRDLLRAIDFYASVLAMASHDLRQPLQAIVSAHELLARRLTARPEREHLERSEQAAINWRRRWTSWSKRCSCNSAPAGSNRNPLSSTLFWRVLGYASMELHGGKGSSFVPSEPAR
jgi:hypothetical protein